MSTIDDEALAKKRFLALNLMRVSGAVLVMVGLLFATDRIDVQPAHLIGVLFIVLGMVDFFVMPIILAKRWKSPKA